VSLVVVEEPWRSRGVGSALLEAALRLGRERGCTVCEVETMTFQVRKRRAAVACV
jgi:GNAT superfamily N-acetyltransferase